MVGCGTGECMLWVSVVYVSACVRGRGVRPLSGVAGTELWVVPGRNVQVFAHRNSDAIKMDSFPARSVPIY